MSFAVFDAHCDTMQKITDFGGSLRENNYHLDLKRIHNLKGNYIQIFAAFVNKKQDALPPFLRAGQIINRYFEEIERNSGLIEHCINLKQIEETMNMGKTASLLSIEGGEAIEGSLEKLNEFYNAGVRIMTLCWNYSNESCDGIDEERGAGLTGFGKSVVSEMNRLGMLIDVSHISERGFWDVVETSKSPVAATHSNAKAITHHRRNLDDEQIKAIIKCGGCIGVNFYSDFISDGKCSIKDLLNHIEHVLALGGEDALGLGSDFDGMDSLPCEIMGVEDIYKVFEEMQRIGYSDFLINKISSGNFLKLMQKILL